MEKQPKWVKILLRVLTYVLVAALASFATLCVATGWFPGLGGIGPGIGQSKLEELEMLITQQFIGEADPTLLEDAAADAMVKATGDRWSYYVPAADFAAMMENKNNAYVGIGITITANADASGFDIQRVEPNGPAKTAGLLPGDTLVEANGKSVSDLGLNGTRDVIRGTVGTTVEIGVLRSGEKLTFTVERREIQQEVASYQMLDGNVGYIRITNFNANCARDTIAAIETLVDQGAESLIFDVRFNPGGYKSELVQVLDYLLPEGPLFRSLDYTGHESVDESDADCLKLPMAVLVNGDSYSAAEFFAAALAEYDWATIVGEPTVGKGNFQYTLPLSDGSAVALSVGKYFTPNNVSLADAGGLKPEVPVTVDEETAAKIYARLLDPAEDPQIQAALEALSK